MQGEGIDQTITSISKSCVDVEKFKYTPFQQNMSKNNVHYHFSFLELTHNHTVGLREGAVPKAVYLLGTDAIQISDVNIEEMSSMYWVYCIVIAAVLFGMWK